MVENKKKSFALSFFTPALLFISLFAFSPGKGQQSDNPENTNRIQLLVKSKKGSIWLRWAPSTAALWSLGNKRGYIVERFALREDGSMENPTGEKLTSIPLKIVSEAAFEKLSEEVGEAAVVQELVYGKEGIQPFIPNNPASVLQHNNDLENRYGMSLLMCDLNIKVAEACGLFFNDITAIKGKRYIYRVSLVSPPAGLTIEPGVAVITYEDEKPLMLIEDLSVEFRDRSATLKWSTLFHRGIYSAYYIEKSEDGKNFDRISDLPYIHLSKSLDAETGYYVDSLDVNSKTFYYRIIGITPFAEEGPVSNVVSGAGREDLSGYLVLKEAKAGDGKKVTLRWEFPVEYEQQIAGFIVARSHLSDGPFTDVDTTVLSKSIRTVSDETPFYNTYYIVKAVDETGNEVVRSFPYLIHMEDTTPPVIPSGLKGSIDSKGTVKLSWSKNTDEDLMGYRVFKANAPDEEFIEATKDILDTAAFTDLVNMNVLNREVYYKVISVDKNYNTSKYSPLLTLARPDMIAPAAVVFSKVEARDGKIYLEWINSTSADVAKLELVRIEKEDKVTRPLISWRNPIPNTYTEPSPTVGKTYRYKLIVSDSASNTTETLSGELFFETGIRNAVSSLHSTVDREAGKIILDWKNESTPLKCTIYRRKNDGALTLYRTLEGNVNSFTDTDIKMNNVYGYQVQLIFPKGVKSRISEEVKVAY